MTDSRKIAGYALNCTRASQAMPTQVNKAKIALLDFDLRKFKMSLGVQVRPPLLSGLKNPSESETWSRMCTVLHGDRGVGVAWTCACLSLS